MKTFEGSACKQGHGTLRYTSSGQCVECAKRRAESYTERLRELLRTGQP